MSQIHGDSLVRAESVSYSRDGKQAKVALLTNA